MTMSVTSLMTKYGDNPVEHKISTLQCLFPLACLTSITNSPNVFTLREEFVLVFQEYGSRTQAYSLAYNRRGKNCGLYKVTLKRSLNGLCSHSATWPCSRQALRVRHACICKFVFVFAWICKFVFVFAWICKCCTWANTSINTSYLATPLREDFCSSKFGFLVHFYRRCLTICNFFDPKGFLRVRLTTFVMSSVVNACNSGAHIEDAHKKCSSGGYEGKFGGWRRGCRGKGDEAAVMVLERSPCWRWWWWCCSKGKGHQANPFFWSSQCRH